MPTRANWPTVTLATDDSYVCNVFFCDRYLKSRKERTRLVIYGSLEKAVQGVPHPFLSGYHLGGCFAFLFFLRITPKYLQKLKLVIPQPEVVAISHDTQVRNRAGQQAALARKTSGRPWLDIDEALHPNPLWRKVTSFWGTLVARRCVVCCGRVADDVLISCFVAVECE